MKYVDYSKYTTEKIKLSGTILFVTNNQLAYIKTDVKPNTKDFYYIYNENEKLWYLMKYVFDYWGIKIFSIVAKNPHEKNILKNSKLNGFYGTIEDSFYFDYIPKVNEIFHKDGFILSSVGYKFDITYTSIWDLNITFEQYEKDEQTMYFRKGHEHNGFNIDYRYARRKNKDRNKRTCNS